MIGEMRDLETAEAAIQASLTGHLVFTTLHTNDAPGAFTRLIDMGVEPFLVASTVEGVMAQRLVRTICPECKVAVRRRTSTSCRRTFRGRDRAAPATAVARARVAGRAARRGFRGRTGIYELMVTSDASATGACSASTPA